MISLKLPEFPWSRKNQLVVRVTSSEMTLLHVKGSALSRCETVSLRETPVDAVRRKISVWLSNEKITEITALLSRSEILQKDFTLAKGSEQDVRQELDSRLQSLLPFSVKDMAWGLRMEPEEEKMEGLLIAAPGQKVKDAMAFLSAAGLDTEILEIVSEDQAVMWAVLEAGYKGTSLVLEKNGSRVLAVLVKDQRLVFSMSFETDSSDSEALECLPEISLRLLETGLTPMRILTAGDLQEASRSRLAAHFSTGVEVLAAPRSRPGLQGLHPSLYGALFTEEYPAVSLLPREEKAAKRLRDRKHLLRELLIAVGCLTALVSVLFWGRLQILSIAQAVTAKKIHAIAGSAEEAGKVLSALKIVNRAQTTKEELLHFLADLARQVPDGVVLRELRVDSGRVDFSAETASYDSVSKVVDILEKTDAVSAAKLQSTRLRKNRGQDILEFEVTAQWNI